VHPGAVIAFGSAVRRTVLLVAVLSTWAVRDVRAATLTVELRSALPQASLPRVKVIATSVDGATSPVIGEAAVPGRVTLELPAATGWQVRGMAGGAWTPTVFVGGANIPQTASLEVWPTATIRGTLAPALGVERLTLRFQASPRPPGDTVPVPPPDTVDCTVRAGQFECSAPAALLDFSLRAPGYVSIYRWGERLPPEGTLDLGKLALKRGASLVGTVALAGASKKLDAVLLQLRPQAYAPSPEKKIQGNLMQAAVRPNSRGFFHFEGVSPGDYTLVGSAEGYARSERRVRIMGGMESRLRDPLLLEPPRRLSIAVDPPLDPWGHPWLIELAKVDPFNGELETVASSAFDSSGHWSLEGLDTRTYILSIRRSEQSLWLTREIELDRESDVEIRIPLLKVVGKVRLGQEPLQGFVWFGGEHRSPSTPVPTDAHGVFATTIPAMPQNRWGEIDVVAENPRVRRSLHDVTITIDPTTQIGSLAIDLPSTRVFGEVVSEEGSPVPGATVRARSSNLLEDTIQVQTGQDGVYDLNGLADGTVTIAAVGPGAESQNVDVTLDSASNAAQYLRLVLKRRREVAGIVTGPNGARIVGAQVTVVPAQMSSTASVHPVPTDGEGKFTADVPPGCAEVLVSLAAPGYAYRLVRALVPDEGGLAIDVAQPGGTLVFEVPNASADPDLVPMFVHGRARLPLPFIGNLTTASPGRVTLDLAEPGPWSLCRATRAEVMQLMSTGALPTTGCSEGYLAPSGELVLRLPAASKKKD
jgi:hypothetical protein